MHTSERVIEGIASVHFSFKEHKCGSALLSDEITRRAWGAPSCKALYFYTLVFHPPFYFTVQHQCSTPNAQHPTHNARHAFHIHINFTSHCSSRHPRRLGGFPTRAVDRLRSRLEARRSLASGWAEARRGGLCCIVWAMGEGEAEVAM